MEQSPPSPESLARKARSIEVLKQHGVTFIDHLPVIEDSHQSKLRTKEEVAKRAIAICLTAVKGEGIDQKTLESLVEKYGAAAFFSPKEVAFIKNPSPSQQEKIQFSWRYEDYWVLLWSLGYVETLDYPKDVCDVKKAVGFLVGRTTQKFIADAKFRDLSQILDQADLIYRFDWAVVNARVKQSPTPANLDKGVVVERHYALNWLIGYMDQEWDDISTDT